MRVTQRISTIALLGVAAFALQAKGDYRDDSRAVKVSGGEDHTLVLTADNGIWTCGPNGGYDYEVYESYFGVLGIGSYNPYHEQKTLVRVRGPNDVNYLDDISDIASGWKHSLALDLNGFVWSWGFNSWGQLGINNEDYKSTPVEVLRGAQPDDPCQPSDYLRHIIDISAGRRGARDGAGGLRPVRSEPGRAGLYLG